MTTSPATLQSVSPANPDDMIGRLIDGRYQIRSLIARGGMATVFVATDLRLERRVAIKIMHDHLAADDSFRARFIREARAAAKLQHPNVVNVYDQGEDQSFAYIVMEYVPGITLRDLLHDHHRLTAEQTIDVMDAVLSGLQAAHRVGIVHRDLKPENVLLADDGRIKLSDFGLARAASANTASGHVLLGTIAYLSPELVTKGTAGIRSDIYSLGIMMYEMLTGEQPYRGDQPVNIAYRHANEDVPPPSDVQPDVPSELDDLVAWSTERDPEERPADAGAMLAALRQAEADLSGRPTSAPTTVMGVPVGNEARDPILVSDRDDEWDDWDDGEPTDPSLEPVAAPLAVADAAAQPGAASQPDAAPVGAARADLAPVHEPVADAQLEPAARTKPRKRRWLAVAAIILLVLTLGGGVGGWYFLAGPGSYEATPDVVGQMQADAEGQITSLGFVVGEITGQSSLEAPVGQVLAMNPGANQHLAPGTVIDLTVSTGPAMLEVPDVVGLTEAQARFAIEQAGFTFDDATTMFQFAEALKGTVLAATDGQGGPLPPTMAEQQPIRIVVSSGPVPSVVGSGQSAAIEALATAGLTGTVVGSEFSSTVPEGVVLSAETTTDPVRPGDTIHLVVSKGKEMIAVPNVVGQTVQQATAALEAAGFKVATKSGIPVGLVPTAVVLATDPSPGTSLEAGGTVTITAGV